LGESQLFTPTNIPARLFSLTASNIASVTFTGNNSVGALDNLPLDDLVLSAFPSNFITIDLAVSSTNVPAPGPVTLSANATDTNGVLTGITFYEGQRLLTSSSQISRFGNSPVGPGTIGSSTLPLQGLAAGTYTFSAVAT